MMSAGCTFSKSYLSAPTTVDSPVPIVTTSAGVSIVWDTSVRPDTFSPEKPQTAVGAGVSQFHPGQFLGAENVSARLFGIDARCGILLCADEEHVHARNGTAGVALTVC